MGQNSLDFLFNSAARNSKDGIRSSLMDNRAARWMDVGMTSLDDCPMFTWSLGCTNREPKSPPNIWMARLAMTSLALVLVDVPEPV